MKTAEMIYEGGLRTRVVHLRSRTEIVTDAPTDNHGKGEAFSPTDLLAASLLTCMVTVMGIEANKRGLKMGEVTGWVEKIMAELPRRVSVLNIGLTLKGSSLSKAEKIILESAAINCPVAKSISSEIQTNTQFVYD